MNELIARSLDRRFLDNKKLSATEIASASDEVRANLICALLRLSSLIATLPAEEIGVDKLARLVETAHKLFLWPYPKPIDSSLPNSLLTANTVINLPLIRTTPEQLRAKAREISQSVAS
jgi:hypothetical protein